MADKEPAGSKDEPTPADDRVGSPATPDDAAELGSEPTNDELGRTDEAESGDDVDPDANGAGNGHRTSDREPVTVGASVAGATSGKTSPARRDADKSGDKSKGRATRKRDSVAPAKKRTGPVTFVREAVNELRKVVYPTGQQLVNYFVVVLIFVLFIIAYVSLLDLGFGWAMFQIFA